MACPTGGDVYCIRWGGEYPGRPHLLLLPQGLGHVLREALRGGAEVRTHSHHSLDSMCKGTGTQPK